MTSKIVRKKNKVFRGRLEDTIQQLLHRGFSLLSAKELIAYRNHSYDQQEQEWMNVLCNSSYAVNESFLSHPDGRVKLLRKTPANLLCSKRKYHGGIILDEGMFDFLEGKIVSYDNVRESINKPLDEQEILHNPFWNFFVQGDKAELAKYSSHVLAELGTRKGFVIRASEEKSPYVVLRPWSLTSVQSMESSIDGLSHGQYDLLNSQVIGIKNK